MPKVKRIFAEGDKVAFPKWKKIIEKATDIKKAKNTKDSPKNKTK